MARIRSIKPEFWSSEQVMECSPTVRLLFVGLWNFCDDYGRHTLAPKQIKAQVFPCDDFTPEDIRRMLDELETNGLIMPYTVGGIEYFEVTGWHHQKIDKPQKAKYPGPFDDHSENGSRTLATDLIGEDRKGMDSSGQVGIGSRDSLKGAHRLRTHGAAQ